jgi:hypothetical protein
VTTNTAQVNRLGQFWVLVLMIVGNFVLLTLPPVLLRLYYFRKHFRSTGLRCKRRVGTALACPPLHVAQRVRACVRLRCWLTLTCGAANAQPNTTRSSGSR